MVKICKICLLEKPINKFNEYKPGFYKPTCKKCYRDRWYSKNTEYQKEYDKKRWSENKDKEKERNSKWRKENYKRWYEDRMKNDILFFVKIKTRWCIRSAFKKKGYTKKSKTFEILGIDYKGFKSYIENQFQEGMNWDNHGKWHLDHKIPISWGKTEEDIIKLNHYSNFQPLWSEENLLKKDRYMDL